ncbi:hydrolase [Psychrosphaera aestuarii]|uniref:hydrolase n=1 Tax=Psychrosphaera aestuarii TaxID=1266052 RepID=UPI001B32571B|nr:hydrolase [Psychrosphaera aestuarii]
MIIKSTFKPAWWLNNRHLQTIVPRFYSVPNTFKPFEQEFALSDGDFVELIWSQSPAYINENTPIVIVLHGLEGSFDSFYAKRMMNAIHQKGWVGLLMQFRGCGKKQNRLAKTYHSGQTEDVSELVKYVNKKFPTNPLYSVGFSLGGNMLAKYLGEEGDKSVLSGGIVISAPLDLSLCAHAIGQGFSAVYQKYLVDKLRKKTKDKLALMKERFPVKVSAEQLDDIKILTEFDEAVTAPINGFKSAADYYAKSSANKFLGSIATPTLVIHAKDDPFMSAEVIPNEGMLSNAVRFELSKSGGHVGFISGLNPFKPVFWAEKRTIEFIQQEQLNKFGHTFA